MKYIALAMFSAALFVATAHAADSPPAPPAKPGTADKAVPPSQDKQEKKDQAKPGQDTTKAPEKK